MRGLGQGLNLRGRGRARAQFGDRHPASLSHRCPTAARLLGPGKSEATYTVYKPQTCGRVPCRGVGNAGTPQPLTKSDLSLQGIPLFLGATLRPHGLHLAPWLAGQPCATSPCGRCCCLAGTPGLRPMTWRLLLPHPPHPHPQCTATVLPHPAPHPVAVQCPGALAQVPHVRPAAGQHHQHRISAVHCMDSVVLVEAGFWWFRVDGQSPI